MKKINTITAIIMLFLSAAAASAAGQSDSPEGSSPETTPSVSGFPVKAVRLYTAGLAQIIHEKEVKGNDVLLFPVDYSDMDDILKSLVVHDLNGGSVKSVGFDSDDPLSSVLNGMRVDPSGAPALRDFLERAQGESVTLKSGLQSVSGRIFSVEDPDDGEPGSPVLNLLNGSGIIPIELDKADSVSFQDPQLQHELEKALELISRSRLKNSRFLRIELEGAGTRTIRLSYIKAVPLWKTSYRSSVSGDGSAGLEGWALVQNTGSTPWTDISLSFVAGSPNAFTMDMSSPVYVRRQQKEIAQAAPFAPGSYDGGRVAVESASGNYYKSAAPMMYAEEEMAAEAYYDSSDYTGPGTQPAAQGIRTGNFYRYDIKNPVTIEARSSAMIPILLQEKAGKAVGLYDPEYDAVFKSISLKNLTDAHWSSGPVSVTEGTTYAGDTILPDMPPGSRNILPYAVHGELEIRKKGTSRPAEITSIGISGGYLTRTEKTVQETVYEISGKGEEIIILHPRRTGWTVKEHPGVIEETASGYLLTVPVSEDPVVITEEFISSRQTSLSSLKPEDFLYYIEWEGGSRDFKAALSGLLSLRNEAAETSSRLTAVESRIGRIERDQNRIRENMKVLEKDSELYLQYSSRLGLQEEEITGLYENQADLKAELDLLEARIRAMISVLEI